MGAENKKSEQTDVHLMETYKKLVAFKQEDDRDNFFELMKNIIPGVRKYIKGIYWKLVRTKQIPRNKYRINDFIDELYIKAYDHIQDVKHEENLYTWLIKQADILLDDTLVEGDFNQEFFKNIDDYTKAELEEMEEDFYIDADGDYVMEEDADDMVLANKHKYTLADVFIEKTDDELIKTISDKMEQERVHKNIDMLASKFSLLEYTIFDLNVNHALTTMQIAEIKKIPVDRVEELLQNVKNGIKSMFHKRLF